MSSALGLSLLQESKIVNARSMEVVIAIKLPFMGDAGGDYCGIHIIWVYL